MATKHEPLLLSIFLSTRLNGSSPLTESSVSNSIKWCPACASPLIILLEKFGEESVDTLQSPLRVLPAARKGGVEEGNAISTGGWFCRNCGLHMLPFAPSMPVVSDPVASDKQMLLTDSLELIDGGGVYKSWETEIMSSCGQLLDHIRHAVSVKVRLLDDQWKEMNKREARLRLLDRDLSGRVHGLAESEQRYQERLMKLNDYRDSLMRSIRIQLDDIRRREENLTRENFFLESTENHTMTIKTKPRNYTPSPDRTPERKVELSSAQKTDSSFSQRRSDESNFNRLKKESVVQKLFPESQDTYDKTEKSTYDDFRVIGSSSKSYKSAADERLERSPKFQELLKNFQEHSPPVTNGFQRRFSKKAVTWNNESLELRARKESGNMGSYRDFELTNEDRKACIGTTEDNELRTREPFHKTNLIGNRSNAQHSFNSLSQSNAWLNSPQVKRTEAREQVKQNTMNSTIPADNMHGPVLVRVSKTSIQNDLQKRYSSTPRPQNSTEQQRISSLSTISHPHATPERNCLAYSNSLEAPAFQNKPNISHLESYRRSKQITKTDFAAANNFDQSTSRAAQASHRSDQQTPSNPSQTADPSDRSKWEIRPRFRDDTSGSHNHRSRSHSPKAFLDRSRLLATLNNDFETRTQPMREATYRTSKSHRFAEP